MYTGVISIIFGVGLLALPFAFKATGYALGAIILVLFGLVSTIQHLEPRLKPNSGSGRRLHIKLAH